MHAQMHVQATQIQAQAFVHEKGLLLEAEITKLRTQEYDSEPFYAAMLKREIKLEQRNLIGIFFDCNDIR